MIGYIQGKILDTDGKKAILLTESGIGYEINYAYYLEKEKNVGLFIHHHVSENDESLWGFNSLEDKKMFELLKTVNKVGSSKAYPLVSVIGTKRVIEAILFERAEVLSEAQGIGKKMAEQIILSLKDKIEKFNATNVDAEKSAEGVSVETLPSADSDLNTHSSFNEKAYSDALLALDSLGYKDKDVASKVREQIRSGVEATEEIIKGVLREL